MDLVPYPFFCTRKIDIILAYRVIINLDYYFLQSMQKGGIGMGDGELIGSYRY